MSCPLAKTPCPSKVPKSTHLLVNVPPLPPATGTHMLPPKLQVLSLTCESPRQPSGYSSPNSNQHLDSKPLQATPTASPSPNQNPLSTTFPPLPQPEIQPLQTLPALSASPPLTATMLRVDGNVHTHFMPVIATGTGFTMQWVYKCLSRCELTTK